MLGKHSGRHAFRVHLQGMGYDNMAEEEVTAAFKRFKKLADKKKVVTDADTVRAATGYAIGGVPPFGHATRLPVTVDEDLTTYDVIWAAAGTPNTVFAVAPADLVRASGGRTVDLKTEDAHAKAQRSEGAKEEK